MRLEEIDEFVGECCEQPSCWDAAGEMDHTWAGEACKSCGHSCIGCKGRKKVAGLTRRNQHPEDWSGMLRAYGLPPSAAATSSPLRVLRPAWAAKRLASLASFSVYASAAAVNSSTASWETLSAPAFLAMREIGAKGISTILSPLFTYLSHVS